MDIIDDVFYSTCMKKIIISLVLIFTVTAIAISCNVASAKDKPTVLCISAPMCGACKEFEPTFNAARSKFAQKFNFEKEDINTSQRAKSLGVTETPSVFIIQGGSSKKIGWQCLSDPSCFEQKLKDY